MIQLRTRSFVVCIAFAAVAAACGTDDGAFTAAGGGGGAGGAGGTAVTSSAADASSSNSSSSGAGGAPSCAGLGDACTQCEVASCSDLYCGCYDNPSCVNLAVCSASCAVTDLDCYQSCWTANEAGISDAALLVNCAATTCATGCPGYTPLTPCQQCLYAQCPNDMNACIANPDCTKLLYCAAACTDSTCQNDCYAMYPGGDADATPVGACAQVSCAQACQ